MAQSRANQGEQASSSGKDQSLSLKVMRLSKPSFRANLSYQFERSDVPGDPLLSKSLALSDDFPLSQTLVLPQNFGTIYSGENFRGYLSIHNISPFDVSNVTVKAELQTSSARHTLLDTHSQIPSFNAGSTNDYIVQHTVNEYGVHILVCTASYTRYDGEKKMLRKYFKFQVEKPFTTKTRTFLLEGNQLFCEIQIQNSMKAPLYVSSVTFTSASKLQVVDLNKEDTKEDKESLELFASGLYCMYSGNSRSYIYQLSPHPNFPLNLREIENLGSMEIEWVSTLGEKAKQSTDIFQKKQDIQRDLEVSLSKVPEEVMVEVPFTLECTLTNLGKSTIVPRMLFVKSKMTGVMINGLSGQTLGSIGPKSSSKINLNLFPLLPGVQRISGIRVEHGGQKHDFDNLLQIFVQNAPVPEELA